MLACECSGGIDYFYTEIEERYACAPGTCFGCWSRIEIGDEVLLFETSKDDRDTGDELIGYFRLCERCRGLYWSLTELGYCLYAHPGFVKDAHADYVEMTT